MAAAGSATAAAEWPAGSPARSVQRSIAPTAAPRSTGTVRRGGRATRLGWRYRLNVASRIVLGTAGAYLIAALFVAALARGLPIGRVDAVLVATMLAAPVLAAASCWAFLARTLARAGGGLLFAATVFAAATWIAGAPA